MNLPPPILPQGKLLIDAFVFVFGACVGSFLNVCIYRIPRELSIVTPRSHCTSCQRTISWHDNLPLLSYFLLRGRCRSCGARFSARYVIVEALTATLFLWIWLRFGELNVVLAVIFLVFAGGSIVAAFVDAEHYMIPDAVSIGGMIMGLAISTFYLPLQQSMTSEPIATTTFGSATASLLGILVGSGVVLWIGILGELILQKEAMGFGDIKLMGAIGAFLGWQATVFALGVGCIVGAVVGVGLWILRSATERRFFGDRYLDDAEMSYLVFGGTENRSLPFGPFLILGALAWVLGPLNLHQKVAEFFGMWMCLPYPYPCQHP